MYYQVIDLFRFFDAPDSTITKIEDSLSSIDQDSLTEKEKKDLGVILHAFQSDLLRSPYIRIHPDTGREFMLFMSFDQYKQFAEVTYDELALADKKLRVKAEVEEVSYGKIKAFKVVGMLKAEKVDGETMRRK